MAAWTTPPDPRNQLPAQAAGLRLQQCPVAGVNFTPAQLASIPHGASHKKIATCNLSTAQDESRLDAIMQLAKDNGWDVTCLQETRISEMSQPSIEAWLAKHRWSVAWGVPDHSKDGRCTRGVATLSVGRRPNSTQARWTASVRSQLNC